MPEQNQTRQVAVKLRIADLLRGKYVKEEGWNPNYMLTHDGRKASRVNLIGTVVSIPNAEVNYRNLTLDDGSGAITLRSFEESGIFQNIVLGDVVFVIGRPRQYGNEIYILPEIIKKVQNRLWIEIRKKEIEKTRSKEEKEIPAINDNPHGEQITADEEAVKIDALPEEGQIKEKDSRLSTQQKIYGIIKELDKGEGAEFENVLEKASMPDAEKIISQLLMEGEIFELSKGRLKVLE